MHFDLTYTCLQMQVTRNRLLTAGVLFIYITLSVAEDTTLSDADAAGSATPTDFADPEHARGESGERGRLLRRRCLPHFKHSILYPRHCPLLTRGQSGRGRATWPGGGGRAFTVDGAIL